MTDHGLEVVNVPELRPFIDIVCVHGYGADADVTWSHPLTGKTWINDPEFVNRLPKPARVLSFSYNGDVASNLSAASVAFNADDLLCCIEQALEKSTGGPLYFVAHGFGGIVVKKAIQLLTAVARYPKVKRAVAGIVFFGTPHTESNSDALLQAVKRFVASVGPKRYPELDEDSRQYAAAVGHINKNFNKVKPKDVLLLSYWESKGPAVDSVDGKAASLPIMTRESAMPDPTNRNFDMECDYADLPRFASIFDKRFIMFLSQFSEMITLTFKDRNFRLSPGPPPPPPPSALPAPLPIVLPPPPPSPSPSPSVAENEKKAAEPSKPPPPPQPERDKAAELYRFYIRKTENEDQRAARSSFLQSLRGWSVKHSGRNLNVAPGTCLWFQEHESFKNWLSIPSSANLCFLGEGGQGKTYLASAISEHLRATAAPLDVILTFFCDPKEEDPPIWDYLTWHLLQERPEWFSAIPGRHRSRNSQSARLSFNDAVEIWSEFRQCSPLTDIYLIIDGLDHHGEGYIRNFLQCINKLRPLGSFPPSALENSRHSTMLKVLITSHVSHRASLFPGLCAVAQIPMESTRNDIETYIDLKWAEYHHKEPYLPPPPTRRDITNAAGVYWPFVKFAVEDVRFTSTSHDPKPRSFAEQLPAGLEQHYLTLILPILQSVDNNDVLRTFLILVASKTAGDSLRVPQWTEALKCLHNYDEDMQGDLPELLRRHLGSLLSVSKLGEICVHSTSFAVYLRTLLTPTQKASNMAFLCVKYLLQDRFSDPSSQLRDRSRFWEDSPDKMDSFYKYAATYWVTYVASLKTFDTKLQEVLCKFLSGDCPQFKTWQIARGEMRPGTPDRYTKDAPVTALLYEGATSFFQQFVPAPTELTPEIGLVPRVKEALQRLLLLQTKQSTATISIPNWPNIVDHRGRTPLMAAAHSGQVDLVEYLLKWPTDINARANRGESVLFVALSMNRSVNRYYLEMMESVVDVLLRHGANPNQCDRQGITPLQIACAGDMLPIAKRLMDAGASINAGNVHGGTPLSRAIEKDNEDLLMELLRRRVAVDIWLAVGETPLTWCIINDKRQMFNLLLDITDVNLAREGFGPIHAAAVDPERIEFLRALLTRGDIDVDMGAPGTALHSAIEGGNYEGAELLLQAGAFTGLLPNMSIPPLVAAVRKGDISLVELLLNYQAPVNEISHTSPEKTALTTAVRMKRRDLVSLLLSRGADPSIEDGLDIRGPLHIACAEEKPDLDIIRLLLEAAIPPDINFVPTGRNHVLMSAVWDDDVVLAKLLLQHGVDMNLWLESGSGSGAPLHVAAEKGNLEICKAMLELEPKLLNTQREDVDLYESPLHSACFKGQRKVVQYFLQQGAKADQLSYYYESSPLLLACEAGDRKIVKMILHAAPHMVNVASYLMETPLMKACGTGNLQVIELLLKVGADIYARDTYGDSCVAFAFNDEKKASTPKILDLLLQYGLKINSVLSGDGSTLLEEAISRGNARDVRWVLEKGGDPVQYGELPGRPNSWNALQHAFKSGDKEVIDILLEPRWGLWQHITTPDWYGSSGLYMFTPRRSRAGGMALLLEKSEAQRAITGEDAFAEMMHQRTITGFSALDYALGCSGVLPAARQGFNKAVGSCLEKLVSCERTIRDHSVTLMDMGLLLMLLPEYRSDAQTLLSATLSLPDIDWDNDVISRSVCCYWSCQVCNEPIRDLCCVCLGCQTCSCNGCRDKLNWKATHEHEWLDVPLIKNPDLNSPNIQEILEKVVREMLHTPNSEEASAQPLVVKSAEEEEQERLQSGLQLAVLHAFNYLAVRRPAWTPYLPLSSPAEALIAPFTELISEQRRSVDRWNLFFELSPWRLEEEMRYFSRNLTQSYSDEQLVHHDMAMQRVRELFPVDDDVSDWSDSEDGRPRPRVRPRMAPPPGWNGRPPPPPPWGAAKVGPRIEVKNVM